jgi:hypothetical protein
MVVPTAGAARAARLVTTGLSGLVALLLVAAVASAAVTPVSGDGTGAVTLADAAASPSFAGAATTAFETVPESGSPNGVADTPLAGFPTDGDTFAILTTGDVALADDPNTSTGSGVSLGSPSVRGDTDLDVTILKVDFTAPANTNCLSIDFKFFSEEHPEYVGTQFNDAFIAELDSSTWTTAGSLITAADNFAFDPAGKAISINATGPTTMNAANAAGTTYDAATPTLKASKQIAPGPHSLYLSVFDQGDQVLDSAVFLDNFVVGHVPEPGAECVPGARPTDITNLELTADQRSLPAGIAAVPFSSIPASVIPAFAGNAASTPGGSIPGGSIPGGSIPGGSIPGGSIPGGSITFGSLGFGSTPGGSIPGGSIPGGSIPGGSIGVQRVLQSVLLSQIPLTNPTAGATWGQVLAGTALDGRALNTLTLYDVSTEGTGQAWARLMALSWRDVPLATTLWGGVPLAAWLLGNAPLADLPAPGGGSWADALQAGGGSAAGLDTSSNTVFGVAIAGQLGRTDIGSIPGGSIPGGSIPGGSIPGGSIPAREILLNSIRIAATRLATIDLDTDISPLADIVNCSPTGGFVCTDKTLADAASAGAIRSSATFGMLLDRLVPADHPAKEMTISELIFGFLAMSRYPFEQLNVQGMQEFAGTGQNASYHVDFDLDCSRVSSFEIEVRLPAGEFPVAGSTTFSFGGGAPVAAADAGLDRVEDVWSATWADIPDGACPAGATTSRHVRMSFEAYERLTIGGHAASVSVSTGDDIQSVSDQAPIETRENHEPNDAPAEATPIVKDTLYPAHISSADDLDVYRFSLAGLAPGTKVAAFMKVPNGADFDFILRTPGAPGVRSSPGGSIPGGSIPIEDPGVFVDNSDRPLPPDTLADVPMSTPGGSIPGGSIPGGSIPGGSIPGGSISANRGSATEVAQIVTAGETGDALIDVSGYLDSHSKEPYVLRLQVTPPPPLPPCPPVTGLAAAKPGTLPSPTSTSVAGAKTFFLVNRQRMVGLYGATATNMLLSSPTSPLYLAAARGEVKGVVLPVDGSAAVRSAYAAWDASPCSIEAVNGVVRAINNLVDTYRARAPNTKYVVLLGPDTALPAWRQYDRVQISPEVDEAGELVEFTNDLTQPNALYASAAQNHFLVDGAYGVRPGQRTTWLGRDLPLPQDSVSRFVESPAEIGAQLDQYNDTGGNLDPTSALVTADEFFTDVGEAQAEALTDAFGITPDTLYNSAWTRADLINRFFGKTPVPDIGALNAHYNPWLAQPAAPHPFMSLAQLASTADVVGGTELYDRILFSIGCHSGLNIPDTYPGDPAQKKDWPQTYARARAAVWIGNSGFGYDDTESVALSGRLMLLFAQRLNGPGSIGEQWVDAVNSYHLSAGAWDVLDEKVMLQATFYGPPWSTFESPVTPPAHTAPTPSDPDDDGLETHSLTIDPVIDEHSASGARKWWSIDGETLSVEYRSIQPLTTRDVTVVGKRAHDPFITNLEVHDLEGVEPVRAYPTIERSAYEPNPNFPNIFWPAVPVTVLESSFGATLNLIAGQFRPTPTPSNPELGTERLIDSITVEIGYSTGSDDVRPLISEVGAVMTGPDAARIFVRATDETDTSPLNKVAALYNDGTNFEFVELSHAGGDLYTADVGDLAAPPEVMAEARDDAGNVGYSSNKAFNFTAVTDTSGPDITITTPLEGAVYALGQAVPAEYRCSDNGGVQSCVANPSGANLNTATLGAKSVTVEATDLSGNVTSVTHHYSVAPPILFSRGGEIYSSAFDHTADRRLTTDATFDAEPDWFPGKTKFAFTRAVGANVDVYSVNVVGGTVPTRLTTSSANDTSPAVSPDGTKIAFASDRKGNWDIYVLDVANPTAVTRLTTHPSADLLPAWSADGSQIAWMSTRTGNGDLYTMEADGDPEIQLTSGAHVDSEPTWFGDTIAFSSKPGSSFDIYAVPAAGGTPTQLTAGPGHDLTPSWSGDGAMLAYASNEPGGTWNFDLFTMDADGGHQKRVVANPAIDAFPEW